MKNYVLISLAACLMTAAVSATAFDDSSPIICASVDVYECVDGRDCQEVLPEDVNAPTFFRVDLKKKQLRVSADADPNKADAFYDADGRVVMQGVDTGTGGVFDGTAWTLTLDESTARMVATAAMQQAAVVIFGACTEN